MRRGITDISRLSLAVSALLSVRASFQAKQQHGLSLVSLRLLGHIADFLHIVTSNTA